MKVVIDVAFVAFVKDVYFGETFKLLRIIQRWVFRFIFSASLVQNVYI